MAVYVGVVDRVCRSILSNITYNLATLREELQLPLDETDPRRFQPIKAAEIDQMSFISYDPIVAKLMRTILREGNRHRARIIVLKTLENIKLAQIGKFHKAKSDFERESIELNPTKVLHQAVENSKPLLITKQVHRGGVIYQVPVPVTAKRQQFIAFKWLMESANEKDDQVRIWDSLSSELLSAYNNEGRTIRKKQELHRVCEANRAYAHFRW